jgi:hypothetical protein
MVTLTRRGRLLNLVQTSSAELNDMLDEVRLRLVPRLLLADVAEYLLCDVNSLMGDQGGILLE